MRRSLLIGGTTMVLSTVGNPATATDPPQRRQHVQVLAINDFHGNLEPPAGADGRIGSVPAGGAAVLATHLRRLRRGHPVSLTVGAGDLVGASPLESADDGDRPTIDALDAMGLQVSAIGNHELDDGPDALLALARRAHFSYLAANVRRAGAPLLPGTRLLRAGRHAIGVVGVTLQDTPSVVRPGATDGLTFADEAVTINAAARDLRRRGADAVLALVHEGGLQAGADPDGCDNLQGPITGIAERLHGVDAVISGHTHDAYVCRIGGLLVTSASSYGRMITELDVAFAHGRVRAVNAHNVVATRDAPPDPRVAAIVARARRRAQAVAGRPTGAAASTLSRTPNAAGESRLGDVVADAQRAAGGSDLALMNPGNIRGTVTAGPVTYGELFAVQPFGSRLVTRTLTGAQLDAILEQQFDNPAPGQDKLLQVSRGFAYRYDGDRPAGDRATELSLDGHPLAADARVRVTLNDFLAAGGDGFSAARAGDDEARGPLDVDALADYFAAAGTVAAGPLDRIRRAG